MSAIRKMGKINDNTFLLDIGMLGAEGITAVYLVQGERKCLIDAGTRTEAPRLVSMLKEMDAFPPDDILITHPHWDHTQGIPVMRREASREQKSIRVLAGHEAVLLLADPSFNDVFESGPYESILEVTGVGEGDRIDLGGITLRIYEIPGHCHGHIAVLDEKNRNLFVGDAIGDKVKDDIFLPPFMPPFWDPDAFVSSVDKLKQIPYESLCLAHFGCIQGSEARSILDEALATYNTWWQFYERHQDILNDTDQLLQAMREEIELGYPDLKPIQFHRRVLLGLIAGAGALVGRKTAMMDKLAFGDYLKWLADGYRIYNKI